MADVLRNVSAPAARDVRVALVARVARVTLLASVASVISVALLGALPGCAGEEKVPDRVMEPIVPAGIEGMPGAVAIGDVVLAGQPTPALLSNLGHAGFGTIINLRPNREMSLPESTLVHATGVNYVSIPITADSLGDKELKRFFDEVKGAHERRERLFVHCSSGNRAAALWAMYEITELDVPAEEAVARAREAGLTSAELVGIIGEHARRIGKY
jgi:uncharacterized protein (TIGR01244 family)